MNELHKNYAVISTLRRV